MRPVVGITVDSADTATADRSKYEVAQAYARAVTRAGGTPIYLPHESQQVPAYLDLCDGLILTGGGDPATEPFGQPTDPRAAVIDQRRQSFELALLDGAAQRPKLAVLGICLGMQLQALHAGGTLDQYLPDTLGQAGAAGHQNDTQHSVYVEAANSVLIDPTGQGREALNDAALAQNAGQTTARESEEMAKQGGGVSERDAEPTLTTHSHQPVGSLTVVSAHRQAVADAGAMRVVARAADGVIEAIDDPSRPFYLGVQWHPERGDSDGPLSAGLIGRFVAAARCSR